MIRLLTIGKNPRVTAKPNAYSQRLTFPFPFVHHQPQDWKVDRGTNGKENSCVKPRPFSPLPGTMDEGKPTVPEEGNHQLTINDSLGKERDITWIHRPFLL